MDYPFNAPVILTDALFVAYSGRTGTTGPFTRNVAYFVAEREMSTHLNTLLTPTSVTGVFTWATANPVQLNYGYVQSVNMVIVQSTQNVLYIYQQTDIQNCVLVRDWKRGMVDVMLNPLIYRTTTYPYSLPTPYDVFLGYTAGIPSGTVYNPDFMWCLTQAAQLVLNEMDTSGFLANEAPGGIGIQEFNNELYQEQRVTLGHSIFGSSPIAQQITRLMANYRSRPTLRFH